MVDRALSSSRPLALARWLWVVAAVVVMVLVVGGITRMTESGLSITDWRPVSGVIPPLSEAQWEAEFAAYKQIPQYTQMNGPAGMTLASYKQIFFWEWFHRFIVRTGLSLSFVLPLVWFWARGAIPAGFKPRLIGLLALGGSQAVVGWLMVRSGLDAGADVKVSHFWLAAHLLLALTLLAALVWNALDLSAAARGNPPARLTRLGGLALAALALQLGYGALVAGLRAGPVAGGGWFNWQTWPLMQGSLVPAGIDFSGGVFNAFVADPYLVHFTHRWWAWVALAALIVLARKVRPLDRRAAQGIHAAAGIQVLLGIATVMSGIALWLAALHQLTGALLLVATVLGAHRLGAHRLKAQQPGAHQQRAHQRRAEAAPHPAR